MSTPPLEPAAPVIDGEALAMARASIERGVALRQQFARDMAPRLVEAAALVVGALEAGGKLLIFGNGGSAADAQHIAAELVNRFVAERRALPALALTTDTSALTSIGNDRSFDELFARQVEAFARPGDVALAISTSGRSRNVLVATHRARQLGLHVVAFTGGGGGELASLADVLIDVPGTREVARIQELHLTAGHVLCELIDARLAAG